MAEYTQSEDHNRSIRWTRDQEGLVAAVCRSLRTLAGDNAKLQAGDRFRYHNVVGILGARGAGKSSILEEVFRRMSKEQPSPAELGRKESFWVLPSLDCSVLDDKLSPGAAVLLRVREEGTDHNHST